MIIILCAIFLRYNPGVFNPDDSLVYPRTVVAIENVRKVLPSVANFDTDNFCEEWTQIYDRKGDLVGWVLSTEPFTYDVKGYGGQIPFLICLDVDKRITGLSLLSNNESKMFVKCIEKTGFLDSWNGLSIKEALNEQIDTVTSATFTSRAIIESLKKSLHSAEKTPLRRTSITSPRYIGEKLPVLIIIVISLISFFNRKKSSQYRWILALSSIIVLGFSKGYFLSINLFFNWVTRGGDWRSQFIFVLIAFLTIFLAILKRRNFYCGFLCPYGFCQELVGKIIKTKPHLSERAIVVLKKIKFLFIVFIILSVLIFTKIDTSYFEPFSAFFINTASVFVIVLAIVFLVVSVFYTRFWCNFFCPTGQILNFLCYNKDKKGEVTNDEEQKKVQ